MLDASNISGKLSHAYLITGPEQVGRRTLAIDLACLVNCEPQQDMFGETAVLDIASFPAAQRIRKGQHADVRIIDTSTPLKSDSTGEGGDGGSGPRQQISINHIHDLQRDAALKPFEGKTRVFIIDGAENMSIAASNALLKTLEEPPDSVTIILVTTDSESLPETIVSRCQRIQLRPVATEVIAEELVTRFEVEPEEAERLARLSMNRPGWAISALSDPAVLDIYTQTSLRILTAMSGDLESRFNYAATLSGRFRRDRDGVLDEMKRWLQWMRDIAVFTSGLGDSAIHSEWREALDQMAKQLDEAAITQAANTVLQTREALEANANPRLALEVMMLELPTVKLTEAAMASAPAN